MIDLYKDLIIDHGMNVEKAREYAGKILGNLLVTHQTGAEGKIVKTLFITEGLDYTHEFYIGILLDRTVGKNVIMASTEGGVEIEKVAAETPEKIIKEWIHFYLRFKSQGLKVQIVGSDSFFLNLVSKNLHIFHVARDFVESWVAIQFIIGRIEKCILVYALGCYHIFGWNYPNRGSFHSSGIYVACVL